jgi:post-segregation antitoxin (ccd killing protein)
MARLNVWVPDDLATRARELGLNVSALTQSALRAEVERHATDRWLDSLGPPTGAADHASVMAALDEARDGFGADDER